MKTPDKKSIERKAIDSGLERYYEEENDQEKDRLKPESIKSKIFSWAIKNISIINQAIRYTNSKSTVQLITITKYLSSEYLSSASICPKFRNVHQV